MLKGPFGGAVSSVANRGFMISQCVHVHEVSLWLGPAPCLLSRDGSMWFAMRGTSLFGACCAVSYRVVGLVGLVWCFGVVSVSLASCGVRKTTAVKQPHGTRIGKVSLLSPISVDVVRPFQSIQRFHYIGPCGAACLKWETKRLIPHAKALETML